MDATERVVAGWVLEERLGSGGFGEVWRARRRHAGLRRALKLMPVADEAAFASWRHEISRLEELSHPNIVRFYDADLVAEPGPYGDVAWIATELCSHSLADELRRRPGRVLAPEEVAGMLDAMLAALAAAHASGCVHRDVKPANILLHPSGTWKLCDFGTARLIPRGEAHPGTAVVGTFPYMSPAAHRGRQDRAADLYALGVTVHEALTGQRLHPRPDQMTDSEYVKLVLDTPPVVSPRLDARWRTVVEALIGAHGPHGAGAVLRWFRTTGGATRPPPVADPHDPTDPAGSIDPAPATDPAEPVEPVDPSSPAAPPGRAVGDDVTRRDPGGETREEPPTTRRAGGGWSRRGAGAGAGRSRRGPARPRDEAPPGRRGPATRPHRRERRREPRTQDREHLLPVLVLLVASLVVAGALLYSLVPELPLVVAVMGGVLLLLLLLMALS